MVTTKQSITIGSLLLLIVSSLIVYISMGDDVKLRVDADKSTFYIKLQDSDGNPVGRWLVSGREYNKLMDGSSLMYRDVSNIKVDTIIDDVLNTVTIKRTTPYIRGPVIVDTYFFDGNIADVKLFPISHTIEVFNASGKFYRYELKDLDYSGDTLKLSGEIELNFGMNMKVELEPNYRWGWIYSYGGVRVQYSIPSDYEIYNIRFFDPVVGDNWCYQEFANVSTSCGGLVNGSYTFGGNWINVNNVTDGDWDTYGESSSGSAYLYINYTKPSGATSNSLWQKKDHIGISNISISSTCWDYSNSILMLRAESDLGNLVGWSCYNGTNWYGLLGDFGGDNIYEEGMWWNMPIKNGSIATITANESLSPGNYTWYVNCTDGTYMNQSDVRGIKISEIPITDSCTYTSGDHIYQCSDNCSIPPINAEESFILINGTGTIRGVGNITNASKIRIQGGCRAIA